MSAFLFPRIWSKITFKNKNNFQEKKGVGHLIPKAAEHPGNSKQQLLATINKYASLARLIHQGYLLVCCSLKFQQFVAMKLALYIKRSQHVQNRMEQKGLSQRDNRFCNLADEIWHRQEERKKNYASTTAFQKQYPAGWILAKSRNKRSWQGKISRLLFLQQNLRWHFFPFLPDSFGDSSFA